MKGLASATSVLPIGAGEYSAEIHPGWDIMGNANGGYLLAMAARAAAKEVERPGIGNRPLPASRQAGTGHDRDPDIALRPSICGGTIDDDRR